MRRSANNAQNTSRPAPLGRPPVHPGQRREPRSRARAGHPRRRPQADVPHDGARAAPGRAHGPAPAPGPDRHLRADQGAGGLADRRRRDAPPGGLDGAVLPGDGRDAVAGLADRADPRLLRRAARGRAAGARPARPADHDSGLDPAAARGGARLRRAVPRRRRGRDGVLRRWRDLGGRLSRGDELRRRLARAGRLRLPEQPVGDLGADQEADPLAHARPEGARLRVPRDPSRRQRHPRRVRGEPGGRPARAGRRGAHAHRVRDLSPGGPHDRRGAPAPAADARPAEDEPMVKLNMVKALNLALLQEMERDPDVLVLGEDVGVDGGVFRVTEDLHRTFGGKRVIDSPLAEAAIVGTAVGMALYGLKPVCEIQFSGFAFQCFHQIENHAARYRQRTQGRFHCQMVVRMPYGGGVRALEHHSESEEQFYAHIPGIKMVIPSGPRTARALLTAAIRDPDPVIFFEHKGLYHAAKEEVPDESETMLIGRAQIAQAGRGLTLVAYGAMLRVALEAAETLQAEDGVTPEVIDLLTISPLDRETLVASVAKTGRAVVVHEAPMSFGPGAEIAASIMDGAFLSLEAPIRRVAAYDVPFVGFAREKASVPDVARVLAAARETLAF